MPTSKIARWLLLMLAASGVAGFILVLRLLGWLQTWELSMFDRFISLRPPVPRDDRILIVGVNESDLRKLGKWPISDAVLAQALTNLKKSQPRAIGLDIFRDLPVEPGHAALQTVFQNTPNLIGVEKKVSDMYSAAVAPPPILQKLGQVGLADAVLDPDGRQRRSLLYLTDADSSFHESLGLKLALIYLSASDILPEAGSNNELKLKQTIFRRFQALDGGYVQADDGGYQILLNWRGPSGSFATVSLLDVLQDRVSPQLIRDRIVLIGHNAASIKDFVLTPYSVASDRTTPENMTGVEVQANLTSQIVSAVLDRRAAIQVWDEWLEWLWILGWATIGAALSWNLRSVHAIALFGSLTGVGLTASCYLALLAGWWIPVVPSGMALLVTLVAIVAYKNQSLSHANKQLQQLAMVDGLTQLANRRHFDEFLWQQWQHMSRQSDKLPLSLILCDIDFFKAYNDTYGHQAGDTCIKAVTLAIKNVLQRSTDLACRYGGEEFAIVLPNTDSEGAIKIAEKIRTELKALAIPHESSSINKYVTVSMGVSTTIPQPQISPASLIAATDRLLYKAKQLGRDCFAIDTLE